MMPTRRRVLERSVSWRATATWELAVTGRADRARSGCGARRGKNPRRSFRPRRRRRVGPGGDGGPRVRDYLGTGSPGRLSSLPLGTFFFEWKGRRDPIPGRRRQRGRWSVAGNWRVESAESGGRQPKAHGAAAHGGPSTHTLPCVTRKVDRQMIILRGVRLMLCTQWRIQDNF